MWKRNWIKPVLGMAMLLVARGAVSGDEPAARAPDQRPGAVAKVEIANVFRSSEIVGLPVRNRENKNLGKVEDLVIDLNTGEIRYAALSFGGIAGIGSKLFAIPWSQMTFVFGEKDRHFVYDTTPEQLKEAPGFDASHWPNVADRAWSASIDKHYRVDRTTATDTKPVAYDTVFRASKIKGMKVRNEQNEDLGHVSEIVLSLKDGRVKYMALSHGSVVGVGGKLFAIPMSSYTLRHAQNEAFFILNVSPEQLNRAPGFDSNHWPNTADPNWSAEIDRYYARRADAARDIK